MDLRDFETDPRLFLFTSLTAGSSHIVTATSRLETILKANKLPFQAIDLATDPTARRLWQRRAQQKKLPGLVQAGYVVADLEQVEEWNEFGELHDNLGAPAPAPPPPSGPENAHIRGVNVAPPLLPVAVSVLPSAAAAHGHAQVPAHVGPGWSRVDARAGSAGGAQTRVALPGAAEIAARSRARAEGGREGGKGKEGEEVRAKEEVKDGEEEKVKGEMAETTAGETTAEGETAETTAAETTAEEKTVETAETETTATAEEGKTADTETETTAAAEEKTAETAETETATATEGKTADTDTETPTKTEEHKAPSTPARDEVAAPAAAEPAEDGLPGVRDTKHAESGTAVLPVDEEKSADGEKLAHAEKSADGEKSAEEEKSADGEKLVDEKKHADEEKGAAAQPTTHEEKPADGPTAPADEKKLADEDKAGHDVTGSEHATDETSPPAAVDGKKQQSPEPPDADASGMPAQAADGEMSAPTPTQPTQLQAAKEGDDAGKTVGD